MSSCGCCKRGKPEVLASRNGEWLCWYCFRMIMIEAFNQGLRMRSMRRIN